MFLLMWRDRINRARSEEYRSAESAFRAGEVYLKSGYCRAFWVYDDNAELVFARGDA